MKPPTAGHSRDAGLSGEVWRDSGHRPTALRVRGYVFQWPIWYLTLLTLVLVVLLVALGFWQLARSDAKEKLIVRYEANHALPTLKLNHADWAAEQLHFRAVVVSGELQNAPVLMLNNRVQQGRIGFHHLSLLRLDGAATYLLVNRGWVPAMDDGGPMIQGAGVQSGRQTLRGLLVPVPSSGLRLGEPRLHSGTQALELPYLDLPWLEQTLNVDLLPLMLLLDEDVIEQYQQQRQAVWLSPQRHQGYALQWFLLALLLAIIYLVTNLKRPESR